MIKLLREKLAGLINRDKISNPICLEFICNYMSAAEKYAEENPTHAFTQSEHVMMLSLLMRGGDDLPFEWTDNFESFHKQFRTGNVIYDRKMGDYDSIMWNLIHKDYLIQEVYSKMKSEGVI